MALKKTAKVKKTAKSASSERNMVPLYVLVIMILATAVVVMMNRSPENKPAGDGGKPVVTGGTSKTESAVKTSQTGGTESRTAELPADGKTDEQRKPDDKSDAHAEITKKVRVYFLVYNERTGKIKPGAVVREVKGENDILQTLNALAKGLTQAEEKRGFISAMPESLTFRGVVIRNNIAEIDCSQAFMENAQGDFITGRLNQIFLTATQFPGVAGITVKINGKPVKSLGGDGLMIVWPMRKPL